MTPRILAKTALLPLSVAGLLAAYTLQPAYADIYRWDTNQLIPGTQGITPAPGIDNGNGDQSRGRGSGRCTRRCCRGDCLR